MSDPLATPPPSNAEAFAFAHAAPPAGAEPLASGWSPAGGKPPGAFRVLHTADWHLGKCLHDRARTDEHARFLAFLLQAIAEHQVDALIVAGDVFDSAAPPQSAVKQYYDFLSRLRGAGACAAVIVAGNHDSPGHLEAPREVLRSLSFHVVGTLAEQPADWLVPLPAAGAPRLLVAALPFLRDADLREGLSGQGAAEIQAALVAGIARRYQEAARAVEGWRQQGVPVLATGHLTVVGATNSESEREIHIGGLGAVGADCFPAAFDYVALGHLHRPQAAKGTDHVRYAGSPLALSFSEADDVKEVRLLDFEGGTLTAQWSLAVPPARRLTRVRARYDDLPLQLAAAALASPLPCWVEVTVEAAPPCDNLFALLLPLVTEHGLELVRARVGGAAGPAALREDGEEAAGEDSGDWLTLLDDPAAVFTRRLAAEGDGLSDEDRAALTDAFRELRDAHAERRRNPGNPGAPAPALSPLP